MKNVFFAALILIAGSFARAEDFDRHNQSCSSHLGVIRDGQTAYGYQSEYSWPGRPCYTMRSAVTCYDGRLNGPDLYPYCYDQQPNPYPPIPHPTNVKITEVSSANACQSRMGLIPNGSSAWGYSSDIGTQAFPCFDMFTVVTCLNGKLSGPDVYPFCTDVGPHMPAIAK